MNQAAPISDGMQIVIPTLERSGTGNFFAGRRVMGKMDRERGGLVDINTADA